MGRHQAWETTQLGSRGGGKPRCTDPFLGSQPPIQVLHGTHGIVRMEDVGGRRVVQDKHPPQVSAQPAQVLDVVPPVEDTRLTKQPCSEGPPLVQQVSYWVCILWMGGESSGAKGDPGDAAQRPHAGEEGGLCQEPFTHLGQTGSEQHALEELTHSLQELVHIGPLQHVDLGGGPVRGLLGLRLGVGGWQGAGREPVKEAGEHRGQAGPRSYGGPT